MSLLQTASSRVSTREPLVSRLHSVPLRALGAAPLEFVLGRRWSLGIVLARVGARHFPQQGRTGSHQSWRRGRFAPMAQDVAPGVGEEGDNSALATTGWAEERENLIDPRGRRLHRARWRCARSAIIPVGHAGVVNVDRIRSRFLRAHGRCQVRRWTA